MIRKTKKHVAVKKQPILIPEQIRPMLKALGRLADEHGVPAYAVGGCVRDWCIGIPRVTDIDVAVVGDGIDFAHAAAGVLGATVTTHKQFGTATLILEKAQEPSSRPQRVTAQRSPFAALRIDVVGCRKETYAEPAAYPRVAAGKLLDDLFRRDFTINAMALAINLKRFGQLLDPYGGLKDLRNRRLRVLHPRSFVDDPSRILRAARFVPRFGLSLEYRTARAMRDAIANDWLTRLNRGRLRKELERIVDEPDPLACLACLGRWLNQIQG